MAPNFYNSLESFFDDRWMREAFADLERGLKLVSDFNVAFPPHNLSTSSDGALTLELAVAGYDEDSLSVSAEDGKIVVKSTKAAKEDEGKVMLYKGIRSSSFSYTCPIPTKFDLSKTSAAMKNGILTISVPLAEDRKPKDIKVNIQK